MKVNGHRYESSMSVNKPPTDAELAHGNIMTESQYLMSANFEEVGETTIDKRNSEADTI